MLISTNASNHFNILYLVFFSLNLTHFIIILLQFLHLLILLYFLFSEPIFFGLFDLNLFNQYLLPLFFLSLSFQFVNLDLFVLFFLQNIFVIQLFFFLLLSEHLSSLVLSLDILFHTVLYLIFLSLFLGLKFLLLVFLDQLQNSSSFLDLSFILQLFVFYQRFLGLSIQFFVIEISRFFTLNFLKKLLFLDILVLQRLPYVSLPFLFLQLSLTLLRLLPLFIFNPLHLQILFIINQVRFFILYSFLELVKFIIDLLFLKVQSGSLQLFNVFCLLFVIFLFLQLQLFNVVMFLHENLLNLLLFFFLGLEVVVNFGFILYLVLYLVYFAQLFLFNLFLLFFILFFFLFQSQVFYLLFYLHFFNFQLLLFQLSFYFVHQPFLLQFVLDLYDFHFLCLKGMVRAINGLQITHNIDSFLSDQIQLIFSSHLIVLQLDLYTFFIINSILIDLLDLLQSSNQKLLRFYSLSSTGLEAPRTIQDWPTASMLIEIIQTDYHKYEYYMSAIYNKQIQKRKSSNPQISNSKTKTEQTEQKKRSKSLISSMPKMKEMKSLQQKCNYQLSIEHISFLLEEQRLKELQNINNNICLKKYYQTFNHLFLILYKTSRTVLTYLYYNKSNHLNFDRFQIINALLNHFDTQWNEQIIIKIQTISKNFFELCKDFSQFQKRIEYVVRKICHNKAKSQEIKSSVMNSALKTYWNDLNKIIQGSQNFQFINEMLVWSPERLCFYDIQQFLKNKLCKSAYKEQINKYCKRQELDDDMNISYSFQFLLIEQFTLNLESIEHYQEQQIKKAFQMKIQQKDAYDKCKIM